MSLFLYSPRMRRILIMQSAVVAFYYVRGRVVSYWLILDRRSEL